MITHQYTSLKLISGDTILCIIILEDDDHFNILYPIQMKPTIVDGKEVLTGQPYCPYTDEVMFTVFKQDIIVMNEMNESTIAYYKRLVDMTELVENVEEDSESEVIIINELPENYTFVHGNNTIH